MEVIKTLTIGTIENDKRRLFKAYGTVEQYDRQNELLPISEFRKFMDTWIARGAPIMDGHSNRQIGKGLNWVETTKDGKPAILITGEIYKDYDLDDKVWNAIKSGKKEGLSIGGTFEKKESTEDGSILRGLTGFEFSVVDRCGNQGAVFTELSLAKGETMAEEEKKPEPQTPETQVAPESTPEPPKAEAEKTEDKPTEQPATAEPQAPAVPVAPQDTQQKNEQMVTSFNAESSFKELNALILRMDERLNELEDKLSGKPESEEDAKFEERASEPKEEADKGCGVPEKKEDKPEETEKTQEGVPESEQPYKEQEPKQEMEKQLAQIKKENAELKKSLEVKQVIKAERPSEVTGTPVQQKETYSEIMKAFETKQISWEECSRRLLKVLRG